MLCFTNWNIGTVYDRKLGCSLMFVLSTSSSVSVLMLDEWGGCGFPPARPSWLTDLWMTLSPPLSLRSHTPQQCHICPAAQSATIWNGFVLRTPKWLQITWNLMSLRMLSLMPSLAVAVSVAIDSDNFNLLIQSSTVALCFYFLCRQGCLDVKLSSLVWP